MHSLKKYNKLFNNIAPRYCNAGLLRLYFISILIVYLKFYSKNDIQQFKWWHEEMSCIVPLPQS